MFLASNVKIEPSANFLPLPFGNPRLGMPETQAFRHAISRKRSSRNMMLLTLCGHRGSRRLYRLSARSDL